MKVRENGDCGWGTSLPGARRGLIAAIPMATVIAVFGMSFGVAAVDGGLRPWVAATMSATVMAGGSQFAAVDLWANPSPLIPIVLTVLAINSRHFLFGASLAPWLHRFSPRSRNLGAALITDPSWALTTNARDNGERDLGYLLGSGLTLWAAWVTGTIVGATIGDVLGPRTSDLGLDTLIITYFAVLLIPHWRGRSSLAPWVVAAAVSIWGREFIPVGWNVIAAAGAGGAVGLIGTRRPETPV